MLEEASLEMTAGAFQPENDADKRLLVIFSNYPHPNKDKSATEGRPIYDERVYVMIMVPGDKESIVHRPAWQRDFDRFPKQYAKFLSKQNQECATGTPLKMVPWLTITQVKELEYFNCYTLEQLAEMPDSNAIKFMQLQKLKQQAKDFLRAAKEAAPLTALRAELDTKDSQLEAANRQIADLAKRLEALEAKEAA